MRVVGENRGWARPAHFALVTLLLAGGAACTEPNGAYRRARNFDTGVNPAMDAGVESPTPSADAEEPADTMPLPSDAPAPPEDQADPVIDAAVSPELPPPVDEAPDFSPPADLPAMPDSAPEVIAGACGSRQIDVSSITASDAVAIGSDGTLYFTFDDGVNGWVGRIRPPVGAQPQDIDRRYLRIDNARVISGLVFDRAGTKLYVASVSGEAILAFDLSGPVPDGSRVIGEVDAINDLAVGPDGTLYYSRQSDRNVYAVVDGSPVKVTATPIGVVAQDQSPAALVFGLDGTLFVGMRKGGRIFRLEIVNHQERARVTWSDLSVWANGLAVDDQGSLHVGVYSETASGRVVVVAPDGSMHSDVLTEGRFAGMAFGRGPLDCQDLYVTSPNGPMQRLHRPRRGYYP